MFKKLDVVKFIATGVAAMGTKKIVEGVIAAHVTPVTRLDKITITAASWIISAAAGKGINAYVSNEIDDLVAMGSEKLASFKLQGKLAKIDNKLSTFENEGLNADDFEQDKKGKWRQKVIVDITTD